MSEVVKFPCGEVLARPADEILGESIDTEWDLLVVCGYDADGQLVVHSTDPHGGSVIWVLEQAKLLLLNPPDEEDYD